MPLSLSPAAPGRLGAAQGGAGREDQGRDEGCAELLEALATKLRSAAYSVGGPDIGRLHRRLDRNRSGSVELDDWSRCVRRHLGAEASEAETEAMFAAVDTDGDGLIDEDELAIFLGDDRDLNAPGSADTEQDAEAARQLEEHIAALTAQLEKTRSDSGHLGRTLAAKVAQGSSPSPRGGTSSSAVADRRRKLAKQNQLLQLRRQRMQFAERQLHEQVRNEQTRSGPSSPTRARADSPEESSGFRPAVSSPRVVSYADQPALDPEPTASAAPEWTRAPAPAAAGTLTLAVAEPPQAAAAPPTAPPKTTFARYDLNGDGVLSKDELAKMCVSLSYSVDAAYLDGVMQTFGNAGHITEAGFDGVWDFFGGDDDDSRSPADVLPDATSDPLARKFQAYDLNRSGSLSLFEVQKLLADLGHEVGSQAICCLLVISRSSL